MGLPYLNTKQIQEQKELVSKAISHKPNFFIRNGTVLRLLQEKVSKEQRILEVGCGAGDLAQSLLAEGYRDINCVDLDDYLRSDVKDKVKLALADVSRDSLPYPDGYFDLVLAIAIVEHLENPYHFIREAQRVIKPGGLLLMAVPHIFSWRAKWKFLMSGNLTGYTKSNNHITLFTRDVFQKVFTPFFQTRAEIYGESYLSFLGKKIKFQAGGKYLSNKVLYIMQKNNKNL